MGRRLRLSSRTFDPPYRTTAAGSESIAAGRRAESTIATCEPTATESLAASPKAAAAKSIA